jgi:hypothetical protein
VHDKWSKTLTDGRTVTYTGDITPGTGGVITAQVGDGLVHTIAVKEVMTRDEVEAAFADRIGPRTGPR